MDNCLITLVFTCNSTYKVHSVFFSSAFSERDEDQLPEQHILNVWSALPTHTLQHRVVMVGAVTVVCAEEYSMASTARRNPSACSDSNNWSHQS